MSDEEIRNYLQKNPEVLREFLRKEFRLGSKWLTDFLYREARGGNISPALGRRALEG